MKKIISILLILCIVLTVCSCGKKDEMKDDAVNNEVVEQDETPKDPFYEKVTSSNSRPVAVMIDNASTARPQTGLEDAFMVYEIVVEGATTRLMALFLDSNLEKVGPVRSSRHYFLDYALENDAIYAHCGFSPQAASDIKSLGINNINELYNNNGKNFYRDRSRSAPHNLYASMPELLAYAKDKSGYETKTDAGRVLSYYEFDSQLQSDSLAAKVTLPYNSSYKVSYTYNEETKLYERYINSNPHIGTSGGGMLNAKNIIIYSVKNYSIDSTGRQNIENVGSGEGYYISNGRYIPITWSKSSRSAKTVYKTANGDELKVNPGNTFIQIMPQGAEITIE